MNEQKYLCHTAKLTPLAESATCEENENLNAPRVELAAKLADAECQIAERDLPNDYVERPTPRKAHHPV